MSAATKWILAIVGLLVGNVVAMGVLIGAANAGRSKVLPDYYQRAVHYDDAIEQAAKNRELGWSADAKFERSALVVVVRDRDGVAIQHVETIDAPRGRGVQGVHDVTVTAVRGSDRYVEHLVVEAK